MRKYWWIKLIILIGFFVSWYFADNLHSHFGNTIVSCYFGLYIFILGIFFVDSLAWRMAQSTW